MRAILLTIAIGFLAEATPHRAVAQPAPAGDGWTTWAVTHPEVFEIFGQPFTAVGREHRKATFVPWPLTGFDTHPVGVVQPVVFKGPNGELVANGIDRIVRSVDGGHTWQVAGMPPLVPIQREGLKHLVTRLEGCGMTADGTLLAQISAQYNDGRPYEGLIDSTYHVDLFVSRSTDGGRSWEPRVRLNAAPHENSGGHSTRFFALPDGRIGLSMTAFYQPGTGEPMPVEEMYERTFIWSSSDDGRTWQRSARPICLYGAEPDFLILQSGRLLATIRWQRHKLPHDMPDLATPHAMRHDKPPYTKSKAVGKYFVGRFTAVLHSDDGGATWTEPRIVTGMDEQTGCLVQLSDGAVVLVFGHKTDGLGQRFMLSYDQGATWSRRIYQLHWGGQYASSVVLADDTIVTVIRHAETRQLQALRWRAPLRKQVQEAGFWTPRVAEPIGVPATRADTAGASPP